jgi:beta-mannosidase
MKAISSLKLTLIGLIISNCLSAQSTSSIDLGGTWQVTWSCGGHGSVNIEEFKVVNSSKDPGRYINVPVPMELHKALEQKGIIEDMNFGFNSLKAQWVAEQYWQYQTIFTLPEAASGKQIWLDFKQLDLNAHIYLNGVLAGSHLSAHRPCRINVTDKVKAGENRLNVAIESGLHWVSEKPGYDYSIGLDTWLNKRIWLRKPQYQFLWDWNPKLINVGITGEVLLEWGEKARPDQSVAYASLNNDLTAADITFRSFIEGLDKGSLELTAAIEGSTVQSTEKFELKKGINPYELNLHLANPTLWWPIEQGSQYQYKINYTIKVDGKVIQTGQKRLGIRKVEIDQSTHPVAGRYFTIKVNNRPVFMKGGNWVPADMVYSSVTRERLSKLVDLAIGANFNMLRVWGGGTWAGNDLLEICDEKGILIWHDFLFAVNKYPGDDPDFLEEVKKEIAWGVREFAHHASLVIWCGNNEIELADWLWLSWGRTLPHYGIFHHIMPAILKVEDPYRPYWPSSPFAPDNECPNTQLKGDQHPWDITLGKDGPDFWAYRNRVDRFPNEGGVLGASSPATIRQFLPANEQSMRSFSWEHHDNSCNYLKDTLGITYRTVEYWLGKPVLTMGMENYLYASSLLQAEGLTEYISNYRRRMFSSAAAIFWMYNDSWPVTHGWTIVDYYLRKKLAYYPVKRAFNPVSVVITSEGDKINFYGVNDNPGDWEGQLRYGLFGIKGGLPVDEKVEVKLPANHSTLLKSIDKSQWDKLGLEKCGAFACLTSREGKPVNQYKLLLTKFKDLGFANPKITVVRNGEFAEFNSPAFVWGASIDVNGEAELSDNCFDLIPGVPYKIAWPKDKKLPVVIRTGNELVLKF